MHEYSVPLGVVIERRDIDNPWRDHAYKPIAVIPHAPETERWKKLHSGDGWVHFLAATLPLELHKGETEGYRYNLSQPVSSIYVIVRPGEEAEENEVEPFMVTACPYEAMGYGESGDEIVEAVIMPDDILVWVQQFIEQFHVDEPFKKRKNKKHKDQERRRI